MPATVPKTRTEKTFAWLDLASKAFLVLYGTGYFIESYYDSQFGIGYINPLRSKVGFTGITFGIQIAAILLCFQLEDLVGNSSKWKQQLKHEKIKGRRWLSLPFLATWLMECAIIACILILVFVMKLSTMIALIAKSYGERKAVAVDTAVARAGQGGTLLHILWVYLSSPYFLIAMGCMLWGIANLSDFFPRLTIKIFNFCATVGASILICEIAAMGQKILPGTFLAVIVFVVLVRFGYELYEADFKSISMRRRACLCTLAVTLPVLYASTIYSDISPRWGGAGESTVVIDFERDVPPFGTESPVKLLEETDEGFYLYGSDASSSPKTIYVPRKDVKRVTYTPADKAL